MKKIYTLTLMLCCLFAGSSWANIYYVTNNNINGTGSLNGAITSANSHSGKDSVYFNIPSGTVAGRTITVNSIFPLPTVTDALVIDGTTQLAGNSFGISEAKIQIRADDFVATGLVLSAEFCEVYGLYIHHFTDGLVITEGNFKAGAANFGNVINDCTSTCVKVSNVVSGSILSAFIGVDTMGIIGTAPLATGIHIESSKKITIGGKQPNVRNSISGNNVGIRILDSKFIDVQGNYIGTDVNGSFAVPNTTGIAVTLASNNCEIGGDSIKERNIISGNTGAGLDIDMYSSFIEGNYIGVDATGTLPLGNGLQGIYLRDQSHDNVIGGTSDEAGNVIAYNGGEAVYFQNSAVKNISIRGNHMYCNSQSTGNGGIVINGGNQGILPPTIVIVTPSYASGYAQPGVEVDLYQSEICPSCEGATYLGTVVCDAGGVFTATFTFDGKVTATSNDLSGNTSAFANCEDSSSTSCLISSFTASDNEVCSNIPINFTDQSIPAPGVSIASWSWDFGDGNTSAETNPIHSYDTSGSYTVTLIVESETGCTDTSNQLISIFEGVEAIIDPVSGGCLGNPVHFADSSVSDGGSFIVSWNWSLGDGNSSFFNDFEHTYDSAGTYTVILEVINSNGCPGVDSISVIIQASPIADFSILSAPCPLDTIEFTDLSTVGIGDSIISWHWNFGDGDTSTVQNPSHVYQAAGVYTVELVVTNILGCTGTVSQELELTGGGDASFTYSVVGNTVYFQNTSVFPAEYHVKWKFGDGGTSNQLNPTHTFTESSNYLVCMIVFDDICGINDTTCDNIFVIVGVDDIEQLASTTLFPNPASDHITLDNLPSSINIQSIRLINSIGEEMMTWNEFSITSRSIQLELPHFSDGMYYMEIKANDYTHRKKVVILNQ